MLVTLLISKHCLFILPQTDTQGAVHVANQNLTEVVKQEINHDYSDVSDFLTIGIGIYSCCNTYEDLLSKADKALYRAKSQGRNRFEVYASSSGA